MPFTIRKGRSAISKMPEQSTQTTCRNLTFCVEDSLVRHFHMLANDRDLPMQEVLCSLKFPDWLRLDDRRICSLKMFPVCYRMTKAGHLQPSSPRWMTWGIMSNGLCLTARILESRNPDAGCSLSAILIPDAPEKYFLSSVQIEKLLYHSIKGRQGSRVYDTHGLACTQTAGAGGDRRQNRVVFYRLKR